MVEALGSIIDKSKSGKHKYNSSRKQAKKVVSANSPAKRDRLDISPWAALLAKSGLDLHRSQSFVSNFRLQFKLKFTTFSDEVLEVNGIYNLKSRMLDIFFEYVFYQDVMMDNKVEAHTFKMQFNAHIEAIDEVNYRHYYIEEDVFSFVKNMIKDIAPSGKNPEENFKNFIFDETDFKALMTAENGKAGKQLMALIITMINLAKWKHYMHLENITDMVFPKPERNASISLDFAPIEQNISDIHFSIKNMSQAIIAKDQQTK
jgi:hypothetical protein